MRTDMLMFTEPTIGFSRASRDEDIAAVWVHFSPEACPPWLSSSQVDIVDLFVEIHTTAADPARAAAEWDDERQPLPRSD